MTRRIIGYFTTPDTARRIGFAIGVLTIARDSLWPKLTKKQKEGFDKAIRELEEILNPPSPIELQHDSRCDVDPETLKWNRKFEKDETVTICGDCHAKLIQRDGLPVVSGTEIAEPKG